MICEQARTLSLKLVDTKAFVCVTLSLNNLNKVYYWDKRS